VLLNKVHGVTSGNTYGVKHLILDLHLTTCQKVDLFLSWDDGLSHTNFSTDFIF
jgi:hypothetical protein